jgi:superfamily II DNA or RNA helicase
MLTNKTNVPITKEDMPKNLNTYLGQKGYTILKSELTIKQQLFIKDQLTVKPYVPGSPVQLQKSFPAYRESDKKLYVPRYYGEELFGIAKQDKLTEGDDINLTFNGSLRDYQKPVVEKFLNHISGGGGGLLELPCAWGKTSGSLNICCQIKKKTLVIVHKEFLMNQWIERIQQFVPTAKIGKIQGQIIDIDGKDIVLCMLQSLVLKEYPSSLFDSFGLTIIDEVHHISSETFSNALFKIVTKYMLGLSATMNRKDGTTKVFKMFLGEVIYKVEKKGDNCVQIRAVTYKTNDDDFNETILDFKGQPQISSMISKLCTYNRRTEFIIKLLTDFIEVDGVDKGVIEAHKIQMNNMNPCCEICKKNDNYLLKNTCCDTIKYCMPCLEEIETISEKKKVSKERPKCPTCKKVLKYEQNYIENKYVKPLSQLHTIVLSHNLNVLHYIYKKIVCKNLASVGYYVGGMSEKELKNSETKQVILASFSMASEGLDIPSLNAEFLITPKTDIVQTIGRVLRAKHAFSDPIIYDIVDNHDVFQRQWLKRKAYYKKNNYNIIGCDIYNYNKDTTKWKVLYEPSNTPTTKKMSVERERKVDKTKTVNSRSSTEDTEEEEDHEDEEEEEEEEPKDKLSVGKCLLKFKK